MPALEVERLREALRALVLHQDALRLAFNASSASKYLSQRYQPRVEFIKLLCHQVDRSTQQWQDELFMVLTAWQSDIDMMRGTLYRCGYITRFADGRARIFCACYHLAIDSVSWAILTRDLARLYRGEHIGEKRDELSPVCRALRPILRHPRRGGALLAEHDGGLSPRCIAGCT